MIAIWFSFMRRASRDLFAAMLFFRLLAQYLSSFNSLGTNCFFDFLSVGCILRSSEENFLMRVAYSSKSSSSSPSSASSLTLQSKLFKRLLVDALGLPLLEVLEIRFSLRFESFGLTGGNALLILLKLSVGSQAGRIRELGAVAGFALLFLIG